VRAVPDTNILISAFIWGGNPARLLEAAIDGEVQLFLSQPILDELVRVLNRKGFEAKVPQMLDYLGKISTMVEPALTLNAVKDDPQDNHIVECAVAAKADVIITGDKDLLRMGQYAGIQIWQVSDFLQRQIGR
jgi:putative PIN family toxin of toxin-antitoxin system